MHIYPILEFDPKDSYIIPTKNNIRFNKHLIICFYKEVIDYFEKINKIKKVETFKTEVGKLFLYNLHFHGKEISVIHSPTGAPMAVGVLEEAILNGAKYIIAYGMCGVLDEDKSDRVFIPNCAIRDEGTSYHYMSPSAEVNINPNVVNVIRSVLKYRNIIHKVTKTWTLDAVFRTTINKARRRRLDGCLTVEMECSALTAASKFRNVTFGQILFTGDEDEEIDLNKANWSEKDRLKTELFWVAAESCLML